MNQPALGRERFPRQSLGALYSQIKQARVLLVGAGGIGCELLKNLVTTGFGEIHIIDLDTIDLSNLNRQFLFGFEHIKKPKALVAKDAASKFNPNIKIEAYHADIKESRFNVEWFQSFRLVFNALDNLSARRHVNKMCLAANVPLVESGTTGFDGQVQAIHKGETACYDCSEKEVPKSFPVCTIRSTPSQPIHCIVWAKSYLLPELFGVSEDQAAIFDHTEDAENRTELENLKREAEALKAIRDSMGSEDFPSKVFNKVFKEDIERLRSMEDMWKSKKSPEPLDYRQLQEQASAVESTISSNDQKVWEIIENFAVFKDSLQRLSGRLKSLKEASTDAMVTFDKDDEDTLDFVTSSANLRSLIFGIEPKSKFDTKQMAGNIIPAIATTNAMTAALCVFQAFKVMKENYARAKMLYLSKSDARAINSENLAPPNPNCAVCSVVTARLDVDFSHANLEHLVNNVIKDDLEYGEDFSIRNDVGIVYDPDMEENLSKRLENLGIGRESFLTVVDEEDDNPRVNLQLCLSSKELPPDSKPILLPEKPEIPRKPKKAVTHGEANGTIENGDVKVADGGAGAKRKRSLSPEAAIEPVSKKGKAKATDAAEDGPIVLDADEDGAIVVD